MLMGAYSMCNGSPARHELQCQRSRPPFSFRQPRHHDGGFRTQESTVYQVDDVDPRQILVMKLVPGEYDIAGSIGDYLALVRGSGYSLLCPYFSQGDPLAPSTCDSAAP